jgi:hypothetical protein
MTERLALLKGFGIKVVQGMMRVLKRWRDTECSAGCIPLSPPEKRAETCTLYFSSLHSRIQEEVIGSS